MRPEWVLAGWSPKVQRRAGSASEARVHNGPQGNLYDPTHAGMTLGALWAAYPECRKDLLWDWQHGYLVLNTPQGQSVEVGMSVTPATPNVVEYGVPVDPYFPA
jgi:hypothetical protein